MMVIYNFFLSIICIPYFNARTVLKCLYVYSNINSTITIQIFSSATLPVTIQCLEEKNGIDPRVARFALPIGAAINMDGTALYEAVARYFYCPSSRSRIDSWDLHCYQHNCTAASIGAAGIPQAGLVTM
jgi:Na+/H+-dicarboxylate symporter